jgi:carbon monoxide dehydrogenase subunit G
MELDHEFTVPVPVDQAWSVLLDVERVALCMPGATLDSVDGDHFTGRLKVKLGPMTITYKGSAQIVKAEKTSRTVTLEGSGKEARGAGSASATVQSQLHDEGDTTRVTVHTKLNVTGRPAQFSRNMVAEVGGKLISRFAKNLADQLKGDQAQPTESAPKTPAKTSAETKPDTKTRPETKTKPETKTTAAQESGTVIKGTPASAAQEPDTVTQGTPTSAAQEPDTVTQGTAPPAAAQPQAAPGASAREASASAASAAPAAAPAAEPVSAVPVHRRDDDQAINLLEFAGPSVAKRAAPVVGGLAAVFALRYLFRRRRGRHGR